ncbi:hypothetical protein Aspvir_003553 [Aspergillus viridinutans]|uniref:RBR-type E3 ubiquitin transferase n=1 Tax=Aspergillus viridinutans TaxID=75553 RepID=A0A9P3C4E1_ASPVI|nr:uncharacterized protein Aspvir_003553 [Aspergillus viridinutans]GIK07883.1 hypothetical protein Aspvir_003553 [Aspergillus viridinutans]
MANEQLFPPKCCSQVIPSKQVLSKLTEKEKALFKLKTREYATPARERRYCPAMRCGKWIPLEKLKSRSTTQLCPYCGTAICPGCRDKAHAPGKCSFDPGLTEFLELARTQGWQRCFRCGAMVELHEGCQRIVCRCSADLCYTCGGPWIICHHNALGNVTAKCQNGAPLGDGLGIHDADELAAIVAAMEFAERELEE